MPTILAFLGTRPEVIKLAPVIRALTADPGAFEVELCVVGQQQAILERALAEWKLAPTHRIDLEVPRDRLGATLGAMLTAIETQLLATRPALVLLQGDTTTTFAAALAAFYSGVPFAHVEAGLRTGNLGGPFPEEMHRVFVDRLAAVHYAPTTRARDRLVAEGVPESCIVVVGNTIVDALETVRSRPRISRRASGPRHLLVTAHRRESFETGTRRICEAIRQVVRTHDDVRVTWVLHPHPRARRPVHGVLGELPHVELVEPMEYGEFIRRLESAYLVVTDSGGVQEEAAHLGTPVLVTRQETDRPEAIELGVAQLVGTSTAGIVAAVGALLDDPARHAAMAHCVEVFGDGRASTRIRDDLLGRLPALRCA